MMQTLLFILGILLFIGLVLIHEWGHFYAARKSGVFVEEFGLGFPPRAWGRKLKGGTLLSLNWLPLGGFVKMRGEHDSDTRKGSFGSVNLWSKTKIMMAGVLMNLVAALVLLTILAWAGLPVLITPQTVGQDQFTVRSDTKLIKSEVFAGYVQPGSPADKIGLTNRDVITEVKGPAGDFHITNIGQLHDATQALAGQRATVIFKRQNQNDLVSKQIQLRSAQEVNASLKTDNPKGYLGVEPLPLQVRRSTWSAPVVAAGFSWQLTKLTFQGLGHALAGFGSWLAGIATFNHHERTNGAAQASSQVGGPVAIVAILWGYGALGLNFMLLIIAVISLTLAIMNILPIPALDGGRLFMVLLSRGVFRRPLSQAMEERLVGASMALLLALFALITIVDVKRFF